MHTTCSPGLAADPGEQTIRQVLPVEPGHFEYQDPGAGTYVVDEGIPGLGQGAEQPAGTVQAAEYGVTEVRGKRLQRTDLVDEYEAGLMHGGVEGPDGHADGVGVDVIAAYLERQRLGQVGQQRPVDDG